MGNCQSSTKEWTFVGRDEELKKVKKLLFGEKSKRSILVFGMNKIGKTRFLEELYGELSENHKCVYKDFETDDIESGSAIYNWFFEFLTSLDAREEIKHFVNQFPSQTMTCNVCEKCQLPNSDKCLNRNDLIKKAVNSLIGSLRKLKSEILLFLDNIDKIMDSPIKDSFLYFHRESLKCPKLQTVLASANKPKQTSKAYESCELKPLDDKAILKLLFETTELRDNDSEDEENCDFTEAYSSKFRVFKTENEPFIKAIVGLCEGLPLAAIMSGMLLTEDDCLLTPANLVEILICMRLTSLSPENCPPDDRLEIYKSQMEEVKGVAEFFNCLNENMTGTVLSVEQAVTAASDALGGVETEAMVKLKFLKKAFERCILSIHSKSEEHQMKWHGMLRECQAALNTIDSLPSDNEESSVKAKEMVLKFMKENVVKAGLDFDEDILSNPKDLEFAIKSLSCKEKTRPPIYVTEKDEEESMSLLKGHMASKKVDTRKSDAERLSVMKTHKEFEHNKDNENSPFDDSGEKKKLATRYSVSEGSDSSDSDSVNLQFTNIYLGHTERPVTNYINGNTNEHYSRSPPPYTSQPGPWETTAPRHNQTDGPINSAMNSFVEPPPGYTSNDLNRSAQVNIPDVSRQYPANAVLHNSESVNQYDYRSRSLPSVSSTSYNLQDQQHNTRENYLVSNDNRNLHRAVSDQTFNRPTNKEGRQLENSPRREMDTSVSDSVTGPPAMPYIPPKTQVSVHIPQFDKRLASQHSCEHKNTGHRMSEQKEPIPNMQVDNEFVQSGFPTHGPTDISYKEALNNDLHADHDNFNQISHITFTQSDGQYNPIHDKEMQQLHGQSVQSRLFVSNSKHETHVKRRSPTAVVSPMPKRRSPTNGNKHFQITTSSDQYNTV